MASWYFLLWAFFIISFLGWINDAFLASLSKRKLVNSGMLFGLWCPIYGFGGIFIYILTRRFVDNPLLVFAAVIVIGSTLELITGTILYRLFKKRWWDYTNYPLNLKGHIALLPSLYFGLLGLFLIYLLIPFLDYIINTIPLPTGYVLLALIGTIFATDVILTFALIFGRFFLYHLQSWKLSFKSSFTKRR